MFSKKLTIKNNNFLTLYSISSIFNVEWMLHFMLDDLLMVTIALIVKGKPPLLRNHWIHSDQLTFMVKDLLL